MMYKGWGVSGDGLMIEEPKDYRQEKIQCRYKVNTGPRNQWPVTVVKNKGSMVQHRVKLKFVVVYSKGQC